MISGQCYMRALYRRQLRRKENRNGSARSFLIVLLFFFFFFFFLFLFFFKRGGDDGTLAGWLIQIKSSFFFWICRSHPFSPSLILPLHGVQYHTPFMPPSLPRLALDRFYKRGFGLMCYKGLRFACHFILSPPPPPPLRPRSSRLKERSRRIPVL